MSVQHDFAFFSIKLYLSFTDIIVIKALRLDTENLIMLSCKERIKIGNNVSRHLNRKQTAK